MRSMIRTIFDAFAPVLFVVNCGFLIYNLWQGTWRKKPLLVLVWGLRPYIILFGRY